MATPSMLSTKITPKNLIADSAGGFARIFRLPFFGRYAPSSLQAENSQTTKTNHQGIYRKDVALTSECQFSSETATKLRRNYNITPQQLPYDSQDQ
ncbi:MAG: hypothetical protein IPJ48_14895 [Propionivibrio sp.]|uniref:Uncharacterized protein n=1 Tax=Candidatus Propionivibrio dominans TaxID=2954373 RepID=A0A9D7FLY4_9RHOO|nr:hypothetical protein [Candidatus Propionivibrio dominans]